MITYVNSNIFESPAKVLVNPVNTVGVMGKGLALQFKNFFPEMFPKYQEYCESKSLVPGKLWLYKTEHKWVLNFPTKTTWKLPSKEEYIEAGLKKFSETYAKLGITSISFPQIGCGNGELDWNEVVFPLMNKYLNKIPIDVYVHLRQEATVPEHRNMAETLKWLHTEPQFLSFEELLNDLKTASIKFIDFLNPITSENFEINFDDKNQKIDFSNGGSISYEDLSNTWKVIRQYGYLTRQVVPNAERNFFGNIVGLMEPLEYFRLVRVAEKYESFIQKSEETVGVQLVPSYLEHINYSGSKSKMKPTDASTKT